MKWWQREREYSRPLPEILDGEDWEVRNSRDLHTAYVDHDKREFVVPFLWGKGAEQVRAHTAMHVKISPTPNEIKKISTDEEFVTIQAVEDYRVNSALNVVDIDTNQKRYTDREIEKAFSEVPDLSHPQRQAEAMIAFQGTGNEQKLREMIRKADKTGKVLPVVEEITEKFFAESNKNKEIPDFQTTLDAAKTLIERLKEEIPGMPPPPQGGGGQGEDTLGNSQNLTSQFQLGGNDQHLDGVMTGITDEEAKEAREMGLMSSFTYDKHYGDPGTLKIETPKLDKQIKFKLTASVKMNAADEGVIPVGLHRYATDMRIFRRKGKRRAGAAILVDVSGSMGLSYEDVKAIIHQCPAAVIALYSSPGGNYGYLRVIAEEKRFSADLNKGMGHANVVDVPALEWLAQRKEGKKLWISDGLLTCQNESTPNAEAIHRAMKAIRKGRIERVGDVKDLIKSGRLIDRAFDDGHQLTDIKAGKRMR